MDLPLTLLVAGALLGLGAFAGWRGARPPDFVRGPRMMPWRLIMLLSVAGAVIVLAHAANLAGVATGRS